MYTRTAMLALALSAAVLTGCGRSRITTQIKADGSWSRTDVFTGAEKKEGSMAPDMEETFAFPKGPGWKSHEEKKNDERVLTFERNLAPGASLKGDLSLKGEPGKMILVNTATVSSLGDRFEYRETLHWSGSPADLEKTKPEALVKIKEALPKPLATDANARTLAAKAQEMIVPLMFGPGEPLLALGLVHPDLAERRARQRIGTMMLKLLQDQFGEQIPADERLDIARKLISEGFSMSRPSTPDPSSGDKPDKNSGGLTPLMFIVHGPGRVVSSNGDVDEFSGEVYWALFPEAASLKDIVLTAVFEGGQK